MLTVACRDTAEACAAIWGLLAPLAAGVWAADTAVWVPGDARRMYGAAYRPTQCALAQLFDLFARVPDAQRRAVCAAFAAHPQRLAVFFPKESPYGIPLGFLNQILFPWEFPREFPRELPREYPGEFPRELPRECLREFP